MFDAIYRFLAQHGYPHPIHPTEVHMPIGLIVAALVFSVVAIGFRKPMLARTAHHCTILAGIFLLPTILFGLMDWQHFYAGEWIFAIRLKLILAVVLIILVFSSILLAGKKGVDSKLVLGNYIASFVVVVVLGYLGGNLVYGSVSQQTKAAGKFHAGMEVFNNHCLSCHPKGGNVVDPAKPLLNSRKTDKFDDFLAFIRHPQASDGKAGLMPNFSPKTLSTKDARDLFQYIVHEMEHRP